MEVYYGGLWITHEENNHPKWEERKKIMKTIISKKFKNIYGKPMNEDKPTEHIRLNDHLKSL